MQFPSCGNPGALISGAPSQPAAIKAIAARKELLTGRYAGQPMGSFGLAPNRFSETVFRENYYKEYPLPFADLPAVQPLAHLFPCSSL